MSRIERYSDPFIRVSDPNVSGFGESASKFKHLQGIVRNVLMGKKNRPNGGPMVAHLNIEESDQHGVHVMKVAGRLDATSATIFQKRIENWAATPGAKVVVNLADLLYLSSAGMRVMLAATKKLHSLHGVLAFCALQTPVRKIIEVAGFDSVLKLYQTEIEAMRELKS